MQPAGSLHDAFSVRSASRPSAAAACSPVLASPSETSNAAEGAAQRDVIVLARATTPGNPVDLTGLHSQLFDLGSHFMHDMKALPAVVTRISAGAAAALTQAGYAVIDDRVVHHARPGVDLAPGLSDTVCSIGDNHASRQLGPQGPRASLGADPGYTGKGVGIAIIDSGIAPHPDLEGRVVAFDDEVCGGHKPCDGFGHGTHVAGDAAGSGASSQGSYVGAAPGAHLVGIRVLDDDDSETLSSAVDHLVSGIDWMIANQKRYNIRVANLSLGLPFAEGDEANKDTEPLKQAVTEAVDKAVAHGITVVVAAGNDGDKGRKSLSESPAIDPQVITVGALDTKGTATPADDGVAPFSSRGPTPTGLKKPDLVAPGVNVMSLNAPDSALQYSNQSQQALRGHIHMMTEPQLRRYADRMVEEGTLSPEAVHGDVRALRKTMEQAVEVKPFRGDNHGSPAYVAMDGTSMAAPIVAGVIADMLEANPDLTPGEIKQILTSTAHKLPGFDVNSQGAGALDAAAATRQAASLRTSPLV